jgi:PKD repeat protein
MKAKSTLLLCLVALLVAIPFSTNVGTASTTTRFYVDPPVVNATLGSSFSIEVKVENVTDLYSWSCNLTFRPDVLQVLSVELSSWIGDTSGYPTFSLPTTIDNTAGSVFMGQIIMPNIPPYPNGATGDGSLVTVTFNVTSVGATSIDLTQPLLWTEIGGNNVPIIHVAENGFFDNRLEIVEPSAIFTAPTSGVVGEVLVFNASESNDDLDNGWIVSYEWDFSMGQAFNVEATGEIVTHSFGSKGSYTVGLRVTDNDGLTDITTQSVTIVTVATYYPRLAGKKAWATHHFVEAKLGEINVLYARIKNPNDIETFDAYVRFTAYDAKYGGIEGSVESSTVQLAPGQQTDVTAEFNINAPEFQYISKAYIKAELFYFDGENWAKAALDKWFSFTIVRIL